MQSEVSQKENLNRIITIPNFIFRFTCPKTRILSGFSPFAEFLLRPFYALFCNWRRSLLKQAYRICQ